MKKKMAKAVFRVLSKRRNARYFCKTVYLFSFMVLMYAGVCFQKGLLTEGEEAYTYFLGLCAVLPALTAVFGVDRTKKNVYNGKK